MWSARQPSPSPLSYVYVPPKGRHVLHPSSEKSQKRVELRTHVFEPISDVVLWRNGEKMRRGTNVPVGASSEVETAHWDYDFSGSEESPQTATVVHISPPQIPIPRLQRKYVLRSRWPHRSQHMSRFQKSPITSTKLKSATPGSFCRLSVPSTSPPQRLSTLSSFGIPHRTPLFSWTRTPLSTSDKAGRAPGPSFLLSSHNTSAHRAKHFICAESDGFTRSGYLILARASWSTLVEGSGRWYEPGFSFAISRTDLAPVNFVLGQPALCFLEAEGQRSRT